ncbi:MAG: LuxR family transcriptional regulator [Chloroflexi bacterium]|nr:LuxR family transcriptional regulator [Chloroflexota bacterium]
MPTPILATKLYIPSPRNQVVLRHRLIERIKEGLAAGRKLSLVSAPAGFGKTTLVSEWIAGCGRPVAWLSLDEGDSDPTRFLIYLIAAVQTIAPKVGDGLLNALQSPQPPPIESILTNWLNEIAAMPDNFVLVLDDYHAVDAKPVDDALAFLIEHLPPQMHLVIATREDPHLPLARLRVRDALTELRAVDLRFTPTEAAEFLNRVMGLHLSAEDIAALETRTEGWIAGLQLAALSMQRHQDSASFIKSFTGSHHYVLDYLIAEVLQRQSENVQNFLLRTSILNRLCGSLCDAVLGKDESGKTLAPHARAGVKDEKEMNSESSSFLLPPSSFVLEYLERANLFIIPLDNERRWYRYHHLFGDLLRQRLSQGPVDVTELHVRASQWYEDNGLEFEAFHHAAAANDIDRAARLIQGKGMPLHVRGGLVAVLNWLKSLPKAELDARPVLWVMYAGALTTAGQTPHVEQKLVAAENALQKYELNDETRDLLGRIANNRAVLAITQYQADTVLVQAQRALEYLHRDNLPVRAINTWALGVAYQMKGDRAAASQTFTKAISISQTIGHIFVNQLATIGLGSIQESENKLHLAAETYQRALQLFGDQPLPIACEAHLGLARIVYEWNDLDAAQHHGQQSLQLARQFANIIDRYILSEIFLARLMLAKGDVAGATANLAKANQIVQEHNYVHRMSDVAAAQVALLLRQGDVKAAAQLAQTHNLPLSQARVHLAQGDPAAALAVLVPYREHMEAKSWEDERLRVMVLQAIAHHAHDDQDKAMQVLGDALTLAEPSGFIRLFSDEDQPMAELLTRMKDKNGRMKKYIYHLLDAFGKSKDIHPSSFIPHPLVEPLSQRELEVLRLIAQGLSNREISERLVLALSTVKGHSRIIFDKLHVQRRTEAVARARELGLL